MILRKLKRLLGLGAGEDGGRSERDVTMQDRSDTEAESAVNGIDESTQDETDGSDDPVATGTDADASTESLLDEDYTEEEPSARAEPAEAAGQESDEDGTGAEAESPDVDTANEETAAGEETAADEGIAAEEETEASEEATDSPAVDEIKGIGPAYSERLGEIGIETAADLAGADAEEVANRTTAPEKTVQKWIDRASDQE